MDRDRWRTLEPLLDEALDLSADDRAAWLDALRARAPELAAEVEALLSGEATADRRGFLVEPIDVSLEGLQLGAYRLERPLGRGGMGSVWLARRTDGRFEGVAAVKLLHLGALSETAQRRFEREGSVLARLTHPGIARLLDAGVTAGGQPYLVLEYVAGEPIDAYADARGLSVKERVRLVLQLLGAVGHAHANLVVHRDLKPSNILVTADGTAKLLDFGIAKLLDAGDGASAAAAGSRASALRTSEGAAAFTPEYAAPEQARGDAITTATDVYALGVLLYDLVSGRHPTAEGCRSPIETVLALFEVEPAPLALGDLDTILAKALRKEPRERYQSVGAFADDLARYLADEPVSARPHSLAYRARKFVRRHRAGVAAAAVVVAALVSATLFSWRQSQVAARERDAAVFASERADAQIEFESLLMSELGDRPMTMRELLDHGREALERQYGSDPRMLVTVLAELASRYAELGDSKIRGALLARADSIAAAAGHDDQLAEVRCQVADNLRTQGRYADADRQLRAVAPLLRRAASPRSEAVCLGIEADLANETDHPERSAPAIHRALAIRDSLGETRGLTYVGLLSSLAYTLDQQKRYREALATYRRASAILDSGGRGRTAAGAIVEHDWAVSLAGLGETAAAERLYHDVLERLRSSDPTGHLPPQPLIHYGHAALFDAHLDSARKYFALLATQAAADHDAYWEGRGRFGLALAEAGLGRAADARRTVARFEQIADTAKLKSSDDQITDARVLEASLALAAGDTAAAYARLTAALRARGYFAGQRRQTFRAPLVVAAECALALGRVADALAFAAAARTIATRDSLSTARSAYVGEARVVEGRALLARGDTAAARAALAGGLAALTAGAGADHPRARQAAALLAALPR